MGGLVSFLIASTIFAAIGTAVRGLLRPISWALLAIALSLLIANRLTGIPGSDAEDLANQTTPAPVPTSDQTGDRPVALEGWQDVARELEPVYSDTLADAQDSAAVSNSGSNDNLTNDNLTASPEQATSNPSSASQSSASSVEQSPSPIPGFW